MGGIESGCPELGVSTPASLTLTTRHRILTLSLPSRGASCSKTRHAVGARQHHQFCIRIVRALLTSLPRVCNKQPELGLAGRTFPEPASMDQQQRLPRLSNDAQLMVFGLVKEGMTIDDALEEAQRMERAEAESVQLVRSGTSSQRR